VSDAAGALVRGMERRSRIVVWPRWLLGAYAARALMPFVAQAMMARHAGEFDAIAEREARRGGDGAVGAGGAADRAAR
jgi:hypothetical protein